MNGPDYKQYTYMSLFTVDSIKLYPSESYSHGPSTWHSLRIEYKDAWSPAFFSMNAEISANLAGVNVRAYSDASFSTSIYHQIFSEDTQYANRPHKMSQAWSVTIPATRWFEITISGNGTGFWRHFHFTSS